MSSGSVRSPNLAPHHQVGPFTKTKSKCSKSRMFEQSDASSVKCSDYGWLILYAVALYSFYAIIWYIAWL